MTTTVDPDDHSPPFETWRAIGRLEGQREIKAAIRETNATLDTGFRQFRVDLDVGLRGAKVDLDTAFRQFRTDLDTGLRQYRTDLDAGLRQVNRRLDRLLYAMLAGGSVLLVAIFASRFIGG